MTRLGSFLAWLVALLVLVQATAAIAGAPVTLRRDQSSGPTVTLGDLFDGAGGASGVVVANGAPVGMDAVLDAAVVSRIAHINGLDWDNTAGIRRIIVRSLPIAPTAGQSAKMVETLAYTRNLMAGDMVRPADLTFIQIPSFAAPKDTPRDPSDLIGKIARMPLKAGAAASERDVSNALVIKRDDLIQVAYRAEGISLILEAKAMGSAAVGDTFSAMNTSSKKLIQAVAVGPDQAVVGPEAAQIKSTAFPNLAQFADNR